MAFNAEGDLYFIGWDSGLEVADAFELPDGIRQLLIQRQNYLPFFGPGATSVADINGAGIGFDSQGSVISYIKGVSDVGDRVGFVRCDPDGSNFEPLPLIAGEDISELGLSTNDEFSAGNHNPLQMVLTSVGGEEVLLFTLWDIPVIFQVPAAGGAVTSFHRFSDGFPWNLTLMERQGTRSILANNINGNIYLIDLDDGTESVQVTKQQFTDLFGVDSNSGVRFTDLDYEPVSDKIYCVASIWWNPDVPLTLMAITPDGSSVEKVLDADELTCALESIRTPAFAGGKLEIGAVAVNPVAVSHGKAGLFLGDYWSGLMMVRMDLPVISHTVVKNSPTGTLVDLDLGQGDNLLCFGPFGRLEGPQHADVYLPEGQNEIRVVRDGVIESYQVDVIPAFTISPRSKSGKVQLTWTHQEGIIRYDIYRSVGSDLDNFIKIAETTSTYSTYLDQDVTNDVTHLYAVVAVYEDREVFSSVAASTPSLSRRPGNFDPVIYSSPPPDETWFGSPFSYRILAADSNGDDLIYTLTDAPDRMTISGDGCITWTPDSSQTGTFIITVTVSDGVGGETNQTITVEVITPVLTLVAIEVTPENVFFNTFGETEQLTVTGIYNDRSERNLTAGSTGSVYLPSSGVVMTDENGLLTAMEAGFVDVEVRNGDVRTHVIVDVDLPQVLPPAERIDSVDELASLFGDTVRARWNYRNGSLWSLLNYGDYLSGPSDKDPLTIAQNFLLTHPDIFGLDEEKLADFPVESNYTTVHNGVTHIVFRQTHEGIPFFDNSIQVNVNRDGQVVSVGGDYDPDQVYPDMESTLTATEAVAIAASRLAPDVAFMPVVVSGPTGVTRETVFEPGSFYENHVTSLTLISRRDGVHLAWWVTFIGAGGRYMVMVDAHSEQVLRIGDMVSGIQGKVFLQDPDKGAQVWREFPDNWFDLSNEKDPYPSWGNNCSVIWWADFANPDDPTMWRYCYNTEKKDYEYDFENYARRYALAEEYSIPHSIPFDDEFAFWNTDLQVGLTNVFYWVNYLHDYFYDLGFDEVSGNFQKQNPGGIGKENDRVKVHVESKQLSKTGAFFYSSDVLPSNDMSKWYPVISLGPKVINPAYACDIIIHEYTHGVSSTLVGGPSYLLGLWKKGIQNDAMGEGFSDFFAASITGDPVIGEWRAGPSGFRICPMNACTKKYGDVNSLRDSQYKVSVIWSSTLWDIREIFIAKYGYDEGKRMIEQLLIDGMKMANQRNPDMLDMRDAILKADDENSCGAHQRMLWEVFAGRGLGSEAESKGPRDSNPTADDKLPDDYTKPPEIELAELIGSFQFGVPVDIRLKGKHFTTESRVYIKDVKTGVQEYVDFEHVSCKELIIPDYPFSDAGEYKICVQNLIVGEDGEEEWVADCIAWPPVQCALKATAYASWEGEADSLLEGDVTPEPLLGRNSTSVWAELFGSSRLRAQFKTPAVDEIHKSSIHVLHMSGAVVGQPESWCMEFDGGGSLYFQEVITLQGAELPDGTVITEGTVPCHLESVGSKTIVGPVGWLRHNADYGLGMRVAPLPDGFSLVDPFFFQRPGEGLDDFGELKLWWSSWYHPTVEPPSLNQASESFDLPVSGTIVFYSRWSGFHAFSSASAVSIRISVDYKLVCDDPDVKLIYKKIAPDG